MPWCTLEVNHSDPLSYGTTLLSEKESIWKIASKQGCQWLNKSGKLDQISLLNKPSSLGVQNLKWSWFPQHWHQRPAYGIAHFSVASWDICQGDGSLPVPAQSAASSKNDAIPVVASSIPKANGGVSEKYFSRSPQVEVICVLILAYFRYIFAIFHHRMISPCSSHFPPHVLSHVLWIFPLKAPLDHHWIIIKSHLITLKFP